MAFRSIDYGAFYSYQEYSACIPILERGAGVPPHRGGSKEGQGPQTPSHTSCAHCDPLTEIFV